MSKNMNIPSVSVNYEATGKSKKSNEFGMREMQERTYEKRGEKYLLIKSPPASGKSRALMFLALDKQRTKTFNKPSLLFRKKPLVRVLKAPN